MLYAFVFHRAGVFVSDLYFVNPRPLPGQEGPERGVRLELRMVERGELKGSVYSAQPLTVDRPIWRVDLLESVNSRPGSLDRAHHHPRFDKWEPGERQFVPALSAAPLDWLRHQLEELDAVLDAAGAPAHEVGADDRMAIRKAAPEILGAVRRLLDGITAGELAVAPIDDPRSNARAGWL